MNTAVTERPEVSVIVPVYNAAEHLRECLDSISSQTLREIEIICVNDGSTDQTAGILEEYSRRDGRFQTLTQENQGPGPARNLGMTHARGEYLIFLDADDIFLPEFLQSMLNTAQNTRADIVICRSEAFDSSTGERLPSKALLQTERWNIPSLFAPEEVGERLFRFTPGWPWDKLLRAEFVRAQGLEYPALPNSQDLVFIFPALALAERIAVIEAPMIRHRMNRLSSVSNSRAGALEAPWQAACLCRDILQEKGCMPRCQQAFLTWMMEFLLWHVSSLREEPAQRRCYDLMRKRWFPEAEFHRLPARCYGAKNYLKYCMIKFLPYGAFRSIQRCARKLRG